MSDNIQDIVSDFFPDDIAVNATYNSDSLGPVTVKVIIDRDFFDSVPFGETGIATKRIRATVKTSDFSAAKINESLVIDSITYYIIEPRISDGISELILSKNQVK